MWLKTYPPIRQRSRPVKRRKNLSSKLWKDYGKIPSPALMGEGVCVMMKSTNKYILNVLLYDDRFIPEYAMLI